MKTIPSKEKALDDLAQLAGGAVSILSGLGRNIREDVRSRVDETASRLNLVPREDLTRLEAIVEDLEKRIAYLEKQRTT